MKSAAGLRPAADSRSEGIGTALRLRAALLLTQLVGLIALSTFQWLRHDLTLDFGFYAQMWWSFGHGHWDPYSTVFGFSAIRNNLELIMWPLGLLAPISPSPLTLLYVQDAVLIATGWVALAWIDDAMAGRRLSTAARRYIVGAATVAVLLDPWCYQTALFDFHTHALAGLFAVLSAREFLVSGRRRRWIWMLLLAATGTVGLLAAAGLALSLILSGPRRRRLEGAAVLTAALVVLAVASEYSLLGAAGQVSAKSYHYLDPRGGTHPGLPGYTGGVILHASEVMKLLRSRLALGVLFLLPVGLVGLFRRWTFPVVAAVVAPAALASDPAFFRLQQAFQIWPALTIVLVGTADFLAEAVSRCRDVPGRSALRAPNMSRYVPAAWCAIGIATSVAVLRPEIPYWLNVSAPAAGTLDRAQAHIPPGAEVIATQGIIGRLADRRWIYAIKSSDLLVPVHSRLVCFVVAPGAGIPAYVSPAEQTALLADIRELPGVHLLASGSGVVAYSWEPRSASYVRLGTRRAELGNSANESSTHGPAVTETLSVGSG